MLLKLKLVLAFVCMFLIFSCSGPVKSDLNDPVVDKDKSKRETYEKVLTKWIYEHSNRISIGMAGEIARETVKTDKPLLVLALIEVESNFIPSATSNKGAIGLTQVMFDVHGKMLIKNGVIKEKRDLYDIAPSIHAGSLVLDSCLVQSKGDVSKALEYYLGGKDGAYLLRILSNLANLYMLAK